MLSTSRRTFLGTGAVFPFAISGGVSAVPDDDVVSGVEADLQRYVSYGLKRAGGPGDTACGNWLADELIEAGFTIERQTFLAPFFDVATAELSCGTLMSQVWPQPIVRSTGVNGTEGPIVRVDGAGRFAGSLKGAIALVDLPHMRWSSILAPAVRRPIEAAFAAGAIAAVVITNGPTGKLIALNADGRKPMFNGPVALIAPKDADPFLTVAIDRKPAKLILEGSGGTRSAFNFVGRVDRGKERWLAVSTPRSGWFTCAGERGPGVAAWLYLARWAATSVQSHNLAFVCNTGHEYEYLGAAEAMKAIAPPPAKTDFWLHLGANVAARDWHEIGMIPLETPDSQRYLSISPSLVPLARKLFSGEQGLEGAVPSNLLVAGELEEVIAAGFEPAAGVFGNHRFHHVADDDARCVLPTATASAALKFQALIKEILSLQRSA